MFSGLAISKTNKFFTRSTNKKYFTNHNKSMSEWFYSILFETVGSNLKMAQAFI